MRRRHGLRGVIGFVMGVALGSLLITTPAAQNFVWGSVNGVPFGPGLVITSGGTVTLGAGGAIRTGTTAGDTVLWRAYDTDTGPAYTTLGTMTAGTAPTVSFPALTGQTSITFTGDAITDAGASLAVSQGLHVGGTSDAGDNNLVVDGTLTVSGASADVGAIATQDVLRLLPVTSATRFTGAFTPLDLTLDRTYQMPDESGIVNVTSDNFRRPHLETQTNWTAKSLLDNTTNYVLGSPIGVMTYREEQNKTTSSWIDAGGALDISADNTTNDEGVEIVIGDGLTTEGWITTGNATADGGGCVQVEGSIALIAGTDQLMIGWRSTEAFVGDNVYTGYSDWSAVGINNVDGSVFSEGEVGGGGTLQDDSTVNLANGDTFIFKVCIAKTTRVPTAFYSKNGGALTAITMTNSGTAKTNAIQMFPFITYMQAGGSVDANVRLTRITVTR